MAKLIGIHTNTEITSMDWIEVLKAANDGGVDCFYYEGSPEQLARRAKKLEHSNKLVVNDMSDTVKKNYQFNYGHTWYRRPDWKRIAGLEA